MFSFFKKIFRPKKGLSAVEITRRVAMLSRFARIVIFPGSLEDFEKFIGYKCGMIDTGLFDEGVLVYPYTDRINPFHLLPEEIQNKLFDEGIVGIVNATVCSGLNYRYGLPVAKATA